MAIHHELNSGDRDMSRKCRQDIIQEETHSRGKTNILRKKKRLVNK